MKRVALTFLLASSALAAVPATPPARSDVPLPEALRLAHPLGDAFLLRPAACVPACPLVVVSHSNGMNAALSLTRPHLRTLFARLLGEGYAVLVSDDAGPTGWGAPVVLEYLADVHARAVRTFAFNGRTYNMGYSMGGLPALLTAYRHVYPVSGVLLLDAQVNLLDVWGGRNAKFSAEVGAAHGLQAGAPIPFGRDPLHDFDGPAARGLPVWVAGSAEDAVVAFARNGEALFARNGAPQSRLLRLTGPHLGGTHFGEAAVGDMLMFLNSLERGEGPVRPSSGGGSGEGP